MKRKKPLIEIYLPPPITTNKLYFNKHGRIPTTKYKRWRVAARRMIDGQLSRSTADGQFLIRIEGRIDVEISVCKCRIDLDNCAKAILDALVDGGIIEGDSAQFVRRILLQWDEALRAETRVRIWRHGK